MDIGQIINMLRMTAEDLQERSWDRLERIRKNANDTLSRSKLDYNQGIIHGLDEGAQEIYKCIEIIEKRLDNQT